MAPNYRYVAGKGPQRHKARIGNVNAGLMVGAALLFDLLQFVFSFFHIIPVVGNAVALIVAWYIAAFALVVFGVWFALCGVNYFTGKRSAQKLLTAFSAVIIELVPFVNALPAITGGVIAMIIATRIEDFEGKNPSFETMSPGRKNALAASMIRGRRVPEREGGPIDAQGLRRGISTLSRHSGEITLENQKPGKYLKNDWNDARRFEDSLDSKSQMFEMVRGKDVRATRPRPVEEENTQPPASETP